MLTFNEYTTITNNCSDNKQLSDAINSVSNAALEESSVISHEIKNHAAYLKTCYQLLSSRNDELRSNKFWNNMGSTIDELVNYLERTSTYRYSFKQSETVSCTLSDIINTINEYIKSRYNDLIILDTSNISPECNSALIYASSHFLNIALKEIIDNAYEASGESNYNTSGSDGSNNKNDTNDNNHNNTADTFINNTSRKYILILSAIISPDIKGKLLLSISSNETDNLSSIYQLNNISSLINNDINDNNCNNPELKSKLCKPFYTTRKGHAGLGLSIVNQICLLSGIDWNIVSDNDVVTTVFAFNLQN